MFTFLQQELLVESGAASSSQDALDLLLSVVDLTLEVRERVVDSDPVLVAHVSISHSLVLELGFVN